MYSINMVNPPRSGESTEQVLCIYNKGYLDPEKNTISPKLSLEDNKAGSLEFAITQYQSFYSTIEPMKTTIKVYRDQNEIWEGRVLSAEKSFDNQKSIYVEGALSYFNDSTQESKKYSSCTLTAFIGRIVDVHNAQVASNRQITVGHIDESLDYDKDKDKPIEIDRYTSYEPTMDTLESIVNDYGGHMYVVVENGQLKLYYKKFEELSSGDEVSQKINFGKNLLDFIEKDDYSEYATMLLPLGKDIDDGNEDSNLRRHVTLNNVTATIPEGYEIVSGKYLRHTESFNKYGWICIPKQWDEAATSNDLLKFAKDSLEELQKKHVSIELKVIDLHYLDTNVEALNMYDSVRAISYPHGMNDLYMVTKMEISFDSPEDTTITLGFDVDKSLSAATSSAKATIKSDIKSLPNPNVKQNKTLATAVTINGTEHSTVETAISALNGSKTVTELELDGMFNMKYSGTRLLSGTDLNTLTSAGRYYCDSNSIASAIVNIPEKKAGLLTSIETYTPARIYHCYITNSNNVYHRFYNGSTWSSWKKTKGALVSVDTDTSSETGKTDMSSAIMTMLESTGHCCLGEGIFYVSGNIDMPAHSTIEGCGDKTIIRLLSNISSGYIVKPSDYCTIKNLCLSGGYSAPTFGSSIGSRHGINWFAHASETPSDTSGSFHSMVAEVYIRNFNGSGIRCHDTGANYEHSLHVANSYIDNCYAGINIDYYSEFNKFTDVSMYHCKIACINNGGNNAFCNCTFHATDTGFLIDNSDDSAYNNGHGILTNGTFCHIGSNAGKAIDIKGSVYGFMFNNCQVHFNSINIENSDGVVFNNVEFGRGTTGHGAVINVSGGNLVMFNSCMFMKDLTYPPVITITGNTKTKFINCYGSESGNEITP